MAELDTECGPIFQKESAFSGKPSLFYLELKPLFSFPVHHEARKSWLGLC